MSPETESIAAKAPAIDSPRRVLLTGALGGIGRAIALRLVARGDCVALIDLDEVAANAAARELSERECGLAVGVGADVSDEASVQRAVQRAGDELGGLDAVINNAGIRLKALDGAVDTVSRETWDTTLAVNLTGAFLVCHYAIAGLLTAQDPVVVNVASMAGLTGDPGAHAYSASKGGLIALTMSLAASYGPKGLRAVAVCPGIVNTDMVTHLTASEHGRSSLEAMILLRRLADPDEVAQVVVFALDATYVTACTLPVHGGLLK